MRWYIDRPVPPVAPIPWPMVSTPPPRELRVTVTCELCGYQQKLERKITQPGHVDLICHDCEAPIGVEVTADKFAANAVLR